MEKLESLVVRLEKAVAQLEGGAAPRPDLSPRSSCAGDALARRHQRDREERAHHRWRSLGCHPMLSPMDARIDASMACKGQPFFGDLPR